MTDGRELLTSILKYCEGDSLDIVYKSWGIYTLSATKQAEACESENKRELNGNKDEREEQRNPFVLLHTVL